MTDIDLGAFLSGPQNPEHEALLRLIGASIFNPRGAEADDEPLAVNTGREWSGAEMNALGEMLVRGVSMDLAGTARTNCAHRAWPRRTSLAGTAAEILRAARIIGRLRAFVSRGETERRVENVVTMIEESMALALVDTEAGVRTSLHSDPKAERVFADRVQIQQVLVNLMRNAVEAGMGLGLSICSSIVEAHGGRLKSEPSPGGGTVFRFTLAAAPTRMASDDD